jgi:hypothetical protein
MTRWLRFVALVALIVLFVLLRLNDLFFIPRVNYIERAREDEAIQCDDLGTMFAEQYLAAPTVLPPCY